MTFSGMAVPELSMPLPARIISNIEPLTHALYAMFDVFLRQVHASAIFSVCALLAVYPLVAALSTERRHSFYFGNAPPTDSFEIELTASLLPPASDDAPQGPSRHRTPLKLLFRIDLYRASDKVLIWSSLVRKSLNVPADQKGILMEAERFLANLP